MSARRNESPRMVVIPTTPTRRQLINQHEEYALRALVMAAMWCFTLLGALLFDDSPAIVYIALVLAVGLSIQDHVHHRRVARRYRTTIV